MAKLLLVLMLLALAPGALVHAQSSTIEQRIASALESARKGNQRPVSLLKKDPDLAKGLPYLRRFVSDPNQLVKSSVFALAAGTHTPDAVGILTDLMKDDKGRWGEASVKAFYREYDCKELGESGGTRLRDNLLSFVEKENGISISKSILLLSCFKGDREVVRVLNNVSKNSHRKVALDGQNPVAIATPIDLALAEIGQGDAVERLLQRIETGEVNDLVFAFRTIRFMHEKRVLAALVERIKDKRPAIYPWSDDFYLRVGDLAVNALAQKTEKPLGITVKSNYRYSDEELEKAYALLKTQ